MEISFGVKIDERAGSGMDKIFNGWELAGYAEPSYEAEYGPDRTTLTLPLDSSSDSSGESDDYRTNKLDKSATVRQLSENETVAVEFARTKGRITTRELAAALGKSERTAGNVLKGLAEKGELEWHGNSRSDPSQYYTLS